MPDVLIVGETEILARLGRWLDPETAIHRQTMWVEIEARSAFGVCAQLGCERDAARGSTYCSQCDEDNSLLTRLTSCSL